MKRVTAWLNENSERRYPFITDAVMTLSDATSLADNVLLDIEVVTRTNTVVTLSLTGIAIQANTNAIFTFTGTGFTVSVTVPYAGTFPYRATAFAHGYNVVAMFGAGCVELMAATKTVTCDIDVYPTAVVAAQDLAVDSITSDSGSAEVMTGDIVVVPGYNCDPRITGDTLRLVVGHGLGAGKYCGQTGPNVTNCGEALLRINGATASNDGNIGLEVIGAEIINKPDSNEIEIIAGNELDNLRCG